jgi:hypothetical protein
VSRESWEVPFPGTGLLAAAWRRSVANAQTVRGIVVWTGYQMEALHGEGKLEGLTIHDSIRRTADGAGCLR